MTSNVLLSDFVEQEESSIMESQKKESSEWTNEKHSLYLKSIEASFVDQLYNSSDKQSCRTQKTSSNAISSWKNHTNVRIPSGQFKVLQGGCWSNKKFRRENSQKKDSESSSRNPWIQHFTNGTLQKRQLSTAISQQNPVPESELYQNPGCSNSEVTDQNFVEDLNRPNNRKRKITSLVTNTSNDQVVPFFNSSESAKK